MYLPRKWCLTNLCPTYWLSKHRNLTERARCTYCAARCWCEEMLQHNLWITTREPWRKPTQHSYLTTLLSHGRIMTQRAPGSPPNDHCVVCGCCESSMTFFRTYDILHLFVLCHANFSLFVFLVVIFFFFVVVLCDFTSLWGHFFVFFHDHFDFFSAFVIVFHPFACL